MSANILIVGCGAIGGLFAATLSSVAKVTALDANAEHVKAIRSRGLRVDGKNPRVVQIEATSDPSALKGTAFDAIIFLIKSKMTAAALSQLQPVLSGNPPLVTLQNGMGNAEVLLSASEATCHSRCHDECRALCRCRLRREFDRGQDLARARARQRR